MSRSYKKEAVYKDPNNSQGKKHANRILRRKVKQSVQQEDETIPLLDEVVNAHNFLDFKVRTRSENIEDMKRAKRK